ncbi:hypothetical protein AJ78_08409 [Emergomyces pasteurianus Ep9510]|uniref:AMP-dependent synthetase/ligase domain-containing protein n=1 Tax=Emergomyces pasteurianus Ep9510 TaxID=1447872 RepID=A0A1J9P2N0_9EURO|nr:hypothetical protein AJ78_08409 [Emergomyces pasteurianus Ep9510]
MASSVFPLPGVAHGKRILATVIETRAKDGTNTEPWASVPINEDDLSAGYRDITFQQLNNASNHAAQWLSQAFPTTSEPFQHFAYVGPKDLRYPILAVAAAKLQKVMVLPSTLLTPEAQLRILENTNCKLYLRPAGSTESISNILQEAPHIQQITVPDCEEFFKDDEATPVVYSKTWDEGKDDPWLVYHTSGTTGYPKTVTYSHQMMAMYDTAASLSDFEPHSMHQCAQRRVYTLLPALHLTGMLLSLSVTTFIHATIVMAPPTTPTAQLLIDVFRHGKVDNIVLNPSLIDSLCLSPEGLQLLRDLNCVMYTGAPLSSKSGNLLAPYTHVLPCIGSTEAGDYFYIACDNKDSWDYVSFQKNAGVEFQHHMDDLHELVFIRRPECHLQQIFHLYPDRQFFKTNDLFIEHPEHKGRWKIIGRSDDYIFIANGGGLNASRLEQDIVAHPTVKCALIGGFGRPAPVLLVELISTAEVDDADAFKKSLEPYIEKANEQCHDDVKLSSERLILAKKEKPFVTTLKGNANRMQSLALYEEEIEALFH